MMPPTTVPAEAKGCPNGTGAGEGPGGAADRSALQAALGFGGPPNKEMGGGNRQHRNDNCGGSASVCHVHDVSPVGEGDVSAFPLDSTSCDTLPPPACRCLSPPRGTPLDA